MNKLLIIFLLASVSTQVHSQIFIRYSMAKKVCYHPGDTVHVTVCLRLNPKSCLEGMKKTYIYFSGCEDICHVSWVKKPQNIFQKNMIVRINSDAKKIAKMTITRDTDKESYFRQETFNVK